MIRMLAINRVENGSTIALPGDEFLVPEKEAGRLFSLGVAKTLGLEEPETEPEPEPKIEEPEPEPKIEI